MVEWRKYYAVKGLEVSRRGAVRRTYKDVRTITKIGSPQMLERQVDKDGNLYVEIRNPVKMKLRIDELVARCYLPRPNKWQTLLIHLDGNKNHCWADNLKWVTPPEYEAVYNSGTSDLNSGNVKDFRPVQSNIYVSREGKVQVDGIILKEYDSFFDPDMDREAAVNPFVYITDRSGRQKMFIEELMSIAYLPEPTELKCPVILHKDLNYRNCAADNLEWVERDSDLYQQYLIQREADIEKRLKELNPYETKHLLMGRPI